MNINYSDPVNREPLARRLKKECSGKHGPGGTWLHRTKNSVASALLFLAMFCMQFVHAQVNVNLGEGSTSTNAYLPIAAYFGQSYTQTIFTAAEISAAGGGAGPINSISYRASSIDSQSENWNHWTIHMGQTNATAFATNNIASYIPLSNLQQVFDGGITQVSASGDYMTIVFDTPFMWDGASNIVVAVHENVSGYASYTHYWYSYTGTTGTSIYRYSDTMTYDLRESTGPTTVLSNMKPVVRFNMAQNDCLDSMITGTGTITHTLTGTSGVINAAFNAPINSSGNYEYEIRTAGNPGEATGRVASGTTATTNIAYTYDATSAAATYTFYVRSFCDDAPNPWMNLGSYATVQYLASPYTQGFDSSTTMPAGFSNNGLNIGATAQYAITGNTLYKNVYGTSTYISGTLRFPGLIITEANSDLTFKYKFSPYSGSTPVPANHAFLDVHISTDGGLNYTLLQTYASNANSAVQNASISLASYYNQAVLLRVTFRYDSSTGGDYYVSADDFRISALPACGMPASLTGTIAYNTATLTLTPSDFTTNPATGYAYEVRTSGTMGSGSEGLVSTGTFTGNTVTITDLPYSSTMTFYVRSVCGSIDGEFRSINLTTGIAPKSIPWEETFETTTAPAGFTQSTFTLSNSTAYLPTTSAYYYANLYSSYTTGNVVTPYIDINQPGAVFMFDYAHYNWSSSVSTTAPSSGYNMYIEASTNGTTFTTIATIPANGMTGWQEAMVSLDNYVGEKIRLRIRVVWTSGDANYYLDNFKVYIPECNVIPAATVAAGTNPGEYVATINATGDLGDIEYVLSTDLVTDFETATILPGDTTMTFTDLAAASWYFLYTRNSCGEEVRGWKLTVFQTACPDAVATLSEDFESTPLGYIPACWTKVTSHPTSNPVVETRTILLDDVPNKMIALANGSANTSANVMLVSPELTTLTNGTHYVKFSAWTSDASSDLQVGTVNAAGVFTLKQLINFTTSGSYSEYAVSFTDYTGTDTRIAFRHSNTSTGTVYVNDIVYEVAPGCSELGLPSLISNDYTSAVIGINRSFVGTSEDEVIEYAIRFAAEEPTAADGVVVGDELTITPLVPGATYYLYFRVVCDGEPGEWSMAYATLLNEGENCTYAIDLANLTSPISGDTTDYYNDDFPAGICATPTSRTGRDVWYKIDVPVGYTLSINKPEDDFDSYTVVFYGSCTSATSIECFDDPDSQVTTWTNNTSSTQTVYYVVEAYGTGYGYYELAWELTRPYTTITSFSPADVCGDAGGQTVVITGTNFDDVTAVKFNGLDATFVVNSNTQITATVPAGVSTGAITVVNPESQITEVSSSTDFVVNVITPLGPITGPSAVCVGEQIDLDIDVPSGDFVSSDLLVATVDNDGIVTGITAGTVEITYTIFNGFCYTVSSKTITVQAPVVVTTQPVSAIVAEGDSASITVAANNATAYQWYTLDMNTYEYVPVVDGGIISGATTNTLTFSNVDFSVDGTEYFCQISGLSACGTVESATAYLTVANIGIVLQPVDANLCGPDQVTFTTQTSGLVEEIQWYLFDGFDFVTLEDNATYSGTTTHNLTVNITEEMNGYIYYVEYSTAGMAVSSNWVAVTIGEPIEVVNQPAALTELCYAPATVTLTTDATNYTLNQWQWATSASGPWNNVESVPVPGFTVTPNGMELTVAHTVALTANRSLYFRNVLTGIGGCEAVISDVANITYQLPSAVATATATAIGAGNTTTLSVPYAANTTYQWQWASTASGTYADIPTAAAGGYTYSGSTTNELIISTDLTMANSTRYYRAVMNYLSCPVTSDTVSVAVTGYCSSVPTSNDGNGISNVSISNLNQAIGDVTYANLMSTPVTLVAGETYTMAVTFATGYTYNANIWIDYGRNGVFDSSDLVASGESTNANPTVLNLTFTVPANTNADSYRMRLGSADTGQATPTPCYSSSFGITIDFIANIIHLEGCNGAPDALVATASETSICSAGIIHLSTPVVFADGLTYQWYNSNGPIAGATGLEYTTPTITATESYYVVATCTNSGLSTSSNTVTVNVTSPTLASTTPASRCGFGSITLGAVGADGANVTWYNAATGGEIIGTGTTFTTEITETTTFYAAASIEGTTGNYGRMAPTSTSATTTSSYGLVFDADQDFLLNSVNVYRGNSSSGTLTVVLQNSAGVNISAPKTFTIPAGTVNTPYTLALNLDVPKGTNYRLLATTGTANLIRESSVGGFPYTLGEAGRITAGYISGTSTTYYYFYNWSVTPKCTSATRTPVTATVVEGEALALNRTSEVICEGTSSATPLTIANASTYDTYTISPTTGVSGNAQTGFVFNPTRSTSYTITASNDECNIVVTYDVFVSGTPVVTLATTEADACPNEPAVLLLNRPATTHAFGTGTTANGTSSTPDPLSNYYGGNKYQMLITKDELLASGLNAGSRINSLSMVITSVGGTTTLQNFSVALAHFDANAFTTSFVPNDQMTVVRPQGNLALPTSGFPNTFAIPFTNEFIWDGMSSIVVQTMFNNGNSGTTSLAVQTQYSTGHTNKTLYTRLDSQSNIDAFKNATTGTTVANRPNLIFGSVSPTYVFNTLDGLYTDAAATTPFTGGVITTNVYARPSATTVYEVTYGFGPCTSTATATINLVEPTEWYVDADGDGYGDENQPTVMACNQPAGYAAVAGDCNDNAALVNPSMSEILYNGIDDNCDGNLDEGHQVTTRVITAQCGTTLSAVTTTIHVNSNSRATAYRFKVYNMTTQEENIIERTTNYFGLADLPMGGTYGTTYRISAELQYYGIWLGYYGEECFVSTPPHISDEQGSTTTCDTQLESITSIVHTYAGTNVEYYRFKFTHYDENNEEVVEIVDRERPWINFSTLETAKYGTTYMVEVAIKLRSSANYSAYAAPCIIVSPDVPAIESCGIQAATKSTSLLVQTVAQVRSWRFELTNMETFETMTIVRPVRYIRFMDLPSYQPGAEYAIRVSVMTNGNWSPYGPACSVWAPMAAARGDIASTQFDVAAYPNTYEDDFRLKVTLPTQDRVEVRLYDMLGKELDVRNLEAADVEFAYFGKNLPAGVYNVVVTQGTEVKTVRVIKK